MKASRAGLNPNHQLEPYHGGCTRRSSNRRAALGLTVKSNRRRQGSSCTKVDMHQSSSQTSRWTMRVRCLAERTQIGLLKVGRRCKPPIESRNRPGVQTCCWMLLLMPHAWQAVRSRRNRYPMSRVTEVPQTSAFGTERASAGQPSGEEKGLLSLSTLSGSMDKPTHANGNGQSPIIKRRARFCAAR
jgi:hypothetical protein